MRQKTFSQRLTWALAVLALVTLVVLATQPTVVNALKRLFGYVPNVGIIDQSSEVRVLTGPVTVTREGFTVTVEQAVLNREKAAVVYTYSLPSDYVFPNDSISTTGAPFLTLPDGTNKQYNIPKGQMFTIDGQQQSAFHLKKGMTVSATVVTEEPVTHVSQSQAVTGVGPQMPEKVDDLRKRLHAWREEVGAQMPTRNPKYDPSKPEANLTAAQRKATNSADPARDRLPAKAESK